MQSITRCLAVSPSIKHKNVECQWTKCFYKLIIFCKKVTYNVLSVFQLHNVEIILNKLLTLLFTSSHIFIPKCTIQRDAIAFTINNMTNMSRAGMSKARVWDTAKWSIAVLFSPSHQWIRMSMNINLTERYSKQWWIGIHGKDIRH